MLTLYILGGLAAYLGIGYKCAVRGLEYSAYHNTTKKTAVKFAKNAMFFWPWWLYAKGTDILFWNMIVEKKARRKLEKKQEEEVQKLLDSGEI
jgi:hypothetical protein